MNQSTSQHVKTPPGRERLYVKVQSSHPVTIGKQKGGSLTPDTIGSLTMTGSEIQLALGKGFGRHLVILLVTLKY